MFNFEGIPSMTDRPYSPYLSDRQPQPNNIADQTALFLQNQRAITQKKLQEDDAVNQAIQAGLIPAIGADGKPITFEEALQYSLRSIANNADSSFESRAEEALRNNPVVTTAYPDEASFKGIRDDVVKRSRLISNNHNVNNPLRYGDTPFTQQVEGWNTEDPGFLSRLWHGTLEALGYNGRGDIEHDIARLDERLSAYPKEFRNAFKKMSALHQEDMVLKSLREQATRAQTEEEYQNLHAKIEAQTDKVHGLEKLLTEEDKQILQIYGQEYLQDQRERDNLKNVEQELTPRYSTTWNKDMEIAKLKQEYAARGEDPSFTNPRSFYNGYARKWLGTHLLDWDTLTKEVGGEVLPWVLINGSIDVGAALLTRGMSIPGSVARWMTRFGIQAGMAINSAHNAIDKNLDMYYQKYGTVEGFSRAQSDFMEATAFFLDMYGSRLIANGLPQSIAASMDAYKLSVKEAIGNIFKASRQAYAATGSLATVNAGFKTAYNLANGTAFLEFIGEQLEKAGKNSILTYGGLEGQATKLAGQAITGSTKIARSEIINPALGLATENMMSETARQHARQAGFNTEAIAEAGMKGIAAGPLGHWGGYAMTGVAAGSKAISRKAGSTFRYAYTDNEMHDTKEHVQDVISNGSDKTKAKTYEDLTKKIEELENRATGDRKNKVIRDKVQSTLNKYKEHLVFEDVDSTTSELPDPDVVDRDNPTNKWDIFKQREVKAAKSRYRKDYDELKKEEEIMSQADNRINAQIKHLKDMQTKLGDSIKDESSVYEMGEKTQKSFLKSKGYSEEEAASIIEDAKGKLAIADVSERALNRVRNIFGSHAPGKLNEALKNLSATDRQKVTDELNKTKANYENIPASIAQPTPKANPTSADRDAYNKAKYGYDTIQSIFKNAAEKQQKYRDSLKNKELDIDKLTADEAEALDPTVFDGLSEDEIESVMQLMQSKDFLQKGVFNGKLNAEDSAKKAVQALIGAGEVRNANVANALEKLSQAWQKHQKEAGTHERGTGRMRKSGIQGQREKEGIVDTDTGATIDIRVAADRESDVEPVMKYLQGKHTLGEIQDYIKNTSTIPGLFRKAEDTTKEGLEKRIINFLKERDDFKKLVAQKNPDLSKGEVKALLKKFNSIDALSSELHLSESQAIDILTTSVNAQHTREADANKKASEKASHSWFGKHIDKHRHKTGYETNTELRDKSIKAKEKQAVATQEQKRREELAEAWRADDAAFLYDGTWSKPEILKFMMYIHDEKFGEIIRKINNGELNDENGQFLTNLKNEMLKLEGYRKSADGNTVFISSKWLSQLKKLIIACDNFSREEDGGTFKYLFDNLNYLYAHIQTAIDSNDVAIKLNDKEGDLNLWNNSHKLFKTEILTVDEVKQQKYKIYSSEALPNATAKLKLWYDANKNAKGLYESSYENMLDMDVINSSTGTGIDSKAMLGFSTLVGGALQEKLVTYLGASQVTIGQQFFGIVNEAIENHGDFLWDLINRWGYKEPKAGIKEDYSLRQELYTSAMDPAVQQFFGLEGNRTGAQRTPAEWKARWEERSAYTQRAIAVHLLNNKVVLGRILGLKFKVTTNDATTNATKFVGEPFEQVKSEEELKALLEKLAIKTLGVHDPKKPNLFTKIAMANLLAKNALLDIVIAKKYALHTLVDPNSQESLAKLFTKGMFDQKKVTWKSIIEFVRVFNNSATFRNIVENAKTTPLGERGHLPSSDTIDAIITELNGTGNLITELKKLDSLKAQLTEKPAEFADNLRAVIGNVIAAAGFLELCTTTDTNAKPLDASTALTNKTQIKVDLSISDNSLIELDNVVSYMQEAALNYTTWQPVDEANTSKDQLNAFISAIINSPSKRGKVVELAQRILESHGYDNNKDNFPLTGFLDSISKGEFPQNMDMLSDGSKEVIAHEFAVFIDKYKIPNTVVSDEASISMSYLNSKARTDTLSYTAHRYSELFPSNNQHKLFIKPKNAVFLHERGLDRFLAENPLLANNEYIRLIKEITGKLSTNIQRMSDDVIGDTEFDLDGNIYTHTLQTAIAVGLAMMPRLSVNVNEDFIEALRGKYGTAIADTFAQESNNLIDLSTTAKAMGTQIARILGYNKQSAMFDLIATRLGGIACLSLIAGQTGVKAVWVSKDGSIKDSNSEGLEKANSIPALQLDENASSVKQRLEVALKLRDASGDRQDLSELMLDTELFSNEKLYDTRQQQTNLTPFINEWIDYQDGLETLKEIQDRTEELKGMLWSDDPANNTVIKNPDKKALFWPHVEKLLGKKNITEIKDESTLNMGQIGAMVRVGDVALVMYQLDDKGQIVQWHPDADQPSIPKGKVYYTVMRNRSVVKTDLTEIAPFRMLTTALNMRKGVKIKDTDALHFFAPLLEKVNGEYKLKDVFTRVNDLTPAQIDELCYQEVEDPNDSSKKIRVLTDLGILLYENSRFGSNPNERSGVPRLNMRLGNKEDLKKIVKDCEALLAHKAISEDENAVHTFYFNELNTVNNRLFVDSLRFNYREFKHYRSITSVQDLEINTTSLTADEQALLVAPIMANLGLDIDKMRDMDQIRKAWDALLKDKAFNTLIKTVRDLTRATATKSAVHKSPADHLSINNEILKAIAVFNATTAAEYKAYKAKEGKERDDLKAEIKYNVESVSALSKLANIKLGGNTSFYDAIIQSKSNDTFFKKIAEAKKITGYNILIEVDGLTNGPSIKNIISNLPANNDVFSALYMGATGISRDFNNIIEGYADYGTLDTYLYNGKLAKEDLVYQAYMELQQNNDTHLNRASAYISSLYGLHYEKTGFELPASFLDTFIDALNKALNRDFMKPQVMVIGYEAGRASVIATNMHELDTQFSKMLSKGDPRVLEEWCDNIHDTYGESVKEVIFEYVEGNKVHKAILNVADRTISCTALPGRSIKISALSAEQVRNLSLNHMANPALAEVITDTFSSMYDSIAHNKQVIQTPFKTLTESSHVLCDVFDTMLRKALEHYATHDDSGAYFTSSEFAPALAKIVDELTEGFNTVARGGLEKEEANKALIQFSKKDVESIVGEAIAQYTTTKDGRYYLRVKTGFAARVSLGAGVVPMIVHTYDSSIVHMMMSNLMNRLNQRILTIHDAALLGLLQGKDAIREMNKAHYECMISFLDTMVNYTDNLYKAINSVSALSKSKVYELSDEEMHSLHNSLKDMADKMFVETSQLLSLKERFFNEELRRDESKRIKDFQYSFVGESESPTKSALGIYIPDNAALQGYIKSVQTLESRLAEQVDLHTYKEKITDAIHSWADAERITSDKLKAVFNDKNFLYDDVWRHAVTLPMLIKEVTRRIDGLTDHNIDRLRATLHDKIFDANKATPRYKLKEAMINSYRDSAIIYSGLTGTNAIKEAYKPVVDVNQPLTDLKAANSEVELVRSVYQLSENSYKNNFFHINDEAALQRIRTESLFKMGGFNADKGFISVLSALRSMTGLNALSDMDQTSFATLFNIVIQRLQKYSGAAVNLHFDKEISSDADVTKVAFFSDSYDYTQILKRAKREHILRPAEKFNDEYIIQWFESVLSDLNQFADTKTQLIFTLRSEGDLMHMLALQILKSIPETADKFKNVTMYVAPAITNITSEAPAVNKEVAILQVLKAQHKDLKATYVTSTHYTHNVTLQSYIMGQEISEARTERKLSIGKETILGLQDIEIGKGDRVGTQYKYYKNIELNPSTFGNTEDRGNFNVVTRKDELGRSIEGPQTVKKEGVPIQEPIPTDFLTVPRDADLTYDYLTDILNPSYQYTLGTDTMISPPESIMPLDLSYKSPRLSRDSKVHFEDIMGAGSHVAPIIETSAEGHIASPTLRDYSQHDSTLKEAIFKADTIRKQRLIRYQRSERNEEDWNEYMLPIVVSVPVEGFADKYFVFVTAFDNSITQKDLMESILDRGTGEIAVAQMSRIREGSDLAGMLKESAKTNYRFMQRMSKMKEEEAAIKETSHVIIPEDFISTGLKADVSKLAQKGNLMYRNAVCLNSINNMLSKRGVTEYTLPVQSTRSYEYRALPGGYTGPRFTVGMHKQITMHSMSMATDVFDSLINSIKERKKRERMQFASLQSAQVKRYRGWKATLPEHPDPNSEYGSRIMTKNDIFASSNPLGRVLSFDNAEREFNDFLNDMIEEDQARNVDVSLIQENRHLFRGFITLAGVNVFSDPAGIEASYTGVSSVDNPLERNEVFIGRAYGAQSASEAFMHEMFHTVLVHLGRNNPAIKKKLTDMYSFVVKNLTYADFTDGQTYTNESIMDAITNEKTPDNVEEFLCYYLTNKAFHTAVENMAKRKGANIREVLKANTTGIFRRLLTTIRNWLLGKKAEYQEVETIKQLVNQAVLASMSYNNQYWQNRKELIENATEKDIRELAAAEARRDSPYKPHFNRLIAEKAIETAVNDNKFDTAVRGIIQSISEAAESTSWGQSSKETWKNIKDGFINDMLASLEGVSDRQFNYLILRTRGKAQIDQKREQIKSAINEHVREILKDVPEEYYEQLTAKFVRTDASCLFRNTDKDLNQIRELITNATARDKEIKRLEAVFQNYDYRNYIINSAKGLAQYLVTGFNPTGIGYRNAHEILARAGSSSQTVTVNGPEFNALNQLITLYAFNQYSMNDLSLFSEIPAATLNKLAEVHNGIKDADNDAIYPNALSASIHVPKGELHTTNNTHRYEIIPEAELKAYEWTGYRKVSDAVLDPFFASQYPNTKFVMVRAPYKSDVTTTAGIFSMTNVFKGRSAKGIRIGDAFRTNKDEIPFRLSQEYARIKSYLDKRIYELNSDHPALLQKPTSGNLTLNFNTMNTLCGATFEVNPIESIKQRSTSQKITSIFGNLYGSILERTESPMMNTKIGEAMADIYDNSEHQEEFVWIKPNAEEERFRELYENIPMEIKKVMTERYQDRGIPVHSRALNTVFGYKNLSANDTKKFIEQERIKQNNADQLASAFSINMGNILYNGYLGNIESLFRWFAKAGKENIVIKGMTTSWYNIVSNCVLLHMKGLSAKQMINYQIEALKQYDIIRQFAYQLAVLKRKQILGQYTDADAKAESAIRGSMKSLEIYPLYKEGITGNTIAEDLTESDSWIKKAIHAVTGKGVTRTVISNLALSNESMLYRILADFASLGDITGKYALYKFNKEKFKDEREALRQSLETFIDYSNPLPRQLQLVDDLAVLPFMKYALGIQRVIGQLLTDKPSRSLSWLIAANGLMNVPNTFQSLLDIDSVVDRMQLPVEMFTDSAHVLPSARLLSKFVPDD